MAGDGEQPRRRITAPTIYAAFGFVAAIISFVFLVDPALRPDPRETQAATLRSVAFDPGISLRGYAERVGQGQSASLRQEGPAACVPGNVVYLQEDLQGFKNRRTALRFLTLDAVTHRRLRGVADSVSGGTPALEIMSEAPSDQSVSLQWVQWPHATGSYIERFELFHGENLLAVADTPVFRVNAARYLSLFQECYADLKAGRRSEGQGFAEASLGGGGGGFDATQWLVYVALVAVAGLVGALLVSGASRLRGYLRRP